MPDYNFPDHPVIANLERTGHPDGKEPIFPICPVCGEECETVYKNQLKQIVGCDICMGIDAYDADLEEECFPEREEEYV